MLKSKVFATTALALGGLVFAAPTVMAQQTNQAPKAENTEEIIVTARKRAESLQEVPIAVSAFSAQTLTDRQATTLESLSFAAPNLAITKNQTTANSAQVYIRGIGQDDSSPTNEPGVAIYVDDVYMARSQGALLDLLDFERVEVLRGPQGTLYGRNSSGGAVRFVTRQPSLSETRVLGDVTVGSFNRQDLRASFSAPLIEGVLGFKVDALNFNRDGYVKRRRDSEDINRVKRSGVRAALQWTPSEDFSANIVADYTYDDSGQSAPIPLAAGAGPGGRIPQFDYYTSDPDALDRNEFRGAGLSATLAWDLPIGQLKSITAYRGLDNSFWSDLRGRTASGTDLFRDLNQTQLTQELQLTGESGPVEWVGGLFYLKEDIRNFDQFLVRHAYNQETTSIAVYGEATLNLGRLALTAGGRYSADEKTIDHNSVGLGGPFAINDFSVDWSKFTPKLGASFQATDDILIYANWQEGYKAGAFQAFPQRLSEVTSQVLNPENVKAFEAGVKSQWFDGALTLNGAVFSIDYTDLQLSLFNGATGGFVARTAGAEAWGTELEAVARFSDRFTVSAALGTFESEITDANPADPLTATLRGKKIKHVPDYNFSLAPRFTIPMAGGAEWSIGGTATWVDDIFFDTTNTVFNFQEGHELLDAYFAYEPAGARWRLTLAGQNLTDVEWATTGTSAGLGSLFVAPPRTWSLALRVAM